MGLKDFFRGRIRAEKDSIKRNRDGFGAIAVLEGLMAGATVLGTLSGIFTIPTLMVMSIPAIIGATTMSGLSKSIKNSKENIAHLEALQNNGVDPTRNHERHLKLNELKEEKAQVDKKDDKYTKTLIGGIAAFAIGGLFPLAAPLAAALMYGGYGTMLYGLFNETKTSNQLRELQSEIDKTNDTITAANLKQKFIMTEEIRGNEREKKVENTKGNTKTYANAKEEVVDRYLEELANQDYDEDLKNKTK